MKAREQRRPLSRAEVSSLVPEAVISQALKMAKARGLKNCPDCKALETTLKRMQKKRRP